MYVCVCVCVCVRTHTGMHALRHILHFATLWTVACQASLYMRFSRQEYSSGLPFPPPGDLPDPGIKLMSPVSPALQTDSLPAEPPGAHCNE